jgi:hypothetical protein
MWEFFVEPIDAAKTKFTNHVEVKAAAGFEDALRRQRVTVEQARRKSTNQPHRATS